MSRNANHLLINGNRNRRNSSSISDISDTTVIVPVTGAICHKGNEKPTERWCFELGMRTVSDKDFTLVLSRLQKGFGIKEKCAMLKSLSSKFSCLQKTFGQNYLSGLKDEFFKLTCKNSGRLLYHRLLVIKGR